MNMTLKGALAFTVVSSLLLCLQAGGAPHPPAAADLQLLQGTWEGIVVGDKGTSKNPDSQKTSERRPGEIDLDFLKTGVFETPPQSHEKITIAITGNSFHFHRDTNFWFDTTITLPAGKDPKQLHATIKGGPPSQASSIGQVVRAFFKIEDGTLTLAAIGGAEETPKGFEAAVENRYELRKVQPQKKMSGSGLGSLVLEGHELHASLRTREPDEPHRHLNPGLPPGNPHLSTDAAFVEAIARGASQGRLGREGIRSVLSAFYVDEKDLGFYGLEAESVEEANRREDVLREVWAHNARMGIARVHRAGLVLLVVWTDGVSPECWETVNAKVVERLIAP
jgi:uncharacterized protein (TIGR03067 family)